MTKSKIKELREENERLRQLFLSLSATLLRRVIQQQNDVSRDRNARDAERLTREAEDCFRCARLPGVNAEIAAGLEAAGHALMTEAVAIETRLQRAKRTQ